MKGFVRDSFFSEHLVLMAVDLDWNPVFACGFPKQIELRAFELQFKKLRLQCEVHPGLYLLRSGHLHIVRCLCF